MRHLKPKWSKCDSASIRVRQCKSKSHCQILHICAENGPVSPYKKHLVFPRTHKIILTTQKYLICAHSPLLLNEIFLTRGQQCISPLIAWFMGPTWGPPGADGTQVGPMLATWTLLSGTLIKWQQLQNISVFSCIKIIINIFVWDLSE